jgi:hypothetical protein
MDAEERLVRSDEEGEDQGKANLLVVHFDLKRKRRRGGKGK